MTHPPLSDLLDQLHQQEHEHLSREAHLVSALKRAQASDVIPRVQRMTLRASLEQLIKTRATLHSLLLDLKLPQELEIELNHELNDQFNQQRTPIAQDVTPFALDETPVHEGAHHYNTPRLPPQADHTPSQRLFKEANEMPASVSPQPELLPPLMNTPLPSTPSPEPAYEPISEVREDEPLLFDQGAHNALMHELMQELEEMGLGDLEDEAPPSLHTPVTSPPPPQDSAVSSAFSDSSDFDDLPSLPGLTELGEGSSSGLDDLKRAPRVALGVNVQVISEVVRFDARGHNVNSGGMFIETETPLEPGEEVTVRFELEREALEVEARAQVRWRRLLKDATQDDPCGVGLKFLSLTDRARAAIEAHVSSHLDAGI